MEIEVYFALTAIYVSIMIYAAIPIIFQNKEVDSVPVEFIEKLLGKRCKIFVYNQFPLTGIVIEVKDDWLEFEKSGKSQFIH